TRCRALRRRARRRSRGVAAARAGHARARREAMAARDREPPWPAAHRRRPEVVPRGGQCGRGAPGTGSGRREPRRADRARDRRGARLPALRRERVPRRDAGRRDPLRALPRRVLSSRRRSLAALQPVQAARRRAVLEGRRGAEGAGLTHRRTNMIKSSPWPKVLPPLAIAVAIVVLVASAMLWLRGNGGGADAGDAGLGGLIATARAARASARAACVVAISPPSPWTALEAQLDALAGA